jgi:medium-chain acyl-[acyl-carrier-protein] hydrolase
VSAPLRRLSTPPWPELRLLCVPHAGGSASAFRTWPPGLPPAVEVWAAQPPGRGPRLGETPFETHDEVVAELAGALPDDDLPLALFGHSLGALIAFHLARELRRRDRPAPRLLVVSAREAPQLPHPGEHVHALPDDGVVDAVRRYGGTPAEVFEEPELVELALPSLRADFRISETTEYVPEEPLDLPIVAIGGIDDPDVTREDLEAWREQTAAGFRMQLFAGGHFFFEAAEPAVLQLLARELALVLA